MAALATVCRAGSRCAVMACAAAWWALFPCSAADAAEAELHAVAAKPACLNAAETREMVKSRRLLEPFAALKFAGAQRKAEALSAKLCRIGDDFFYEITFLHRDGRLVHVAIEAGTGKIASRPGHEPRETHETREPHETARARQELIFGSNWCSKHRMRLLVVEDDRDLNRQVSAALEAAGYAVDRAFDGEEGWFRGDTEPYDAVVLDIGLPKRDGISVLEAWRKGGRTMPVLILTARDRWSDKVQGIDAGADDYVAKPFHMEEVLARLRALLRRAAGHASSDLTVGPVRLDARAGRVTVNNLAIKLTSHEYRLLSYLMHHTGRIISRSEIVEHLYEQDFDRDFEHDRSVHRAIAQETRRRHHQDRARLGLCGWRRGRDADGSLSKGSALQRAPRKLEPNLRTGAWERAQVHPA